MNWTIIIDERAEKRLKRVPARDYMRIRKSISDMESDPFFGDINKMRGENVWRRRVGSYRIFYEIHKNNRVVYIFELKRRTSTTY